MKVTLARPGIIFDINLTKDDVFSILANNPDISITISGSDACPDGKVNVMITGRTVECDKLKAIKAIRNFTQMTLTDSKNLLESSQKQIISVYAKDLSQFRQEMDEAGYSTILA